MHQTLCISKQLQSLCMYSDALCCTPDSADCMVLYCLLHLCPCMCCLFVCLSFIYQSHMSLALFVFLPGLLPLLTGSRLMLKSDCIHCIRRGLSRRLRSSLLLNSSPRCNPPCRIAYSHFNINFSPSTSRDISLSYLVETCQSPAVSPCPDTCLFLIVMSKCTFLIWKLRCTVKESLTYHQKCHTEPYPPMKPTAKQCHQ